uniref:Uncharacterized protein n=1 Tax=Caudovirales sp. ctCpR1 TaxID=2825760 RepID=A0A8S5V8R1_9CAUD|nr:MAG TPA: hypothetical protein [Caudovirales sp. ctCpR1]
MPGLLVFVGGNLGITWGKLGTSWGGCIFVRARKWSHGV